MAQVLKNKRVLFFFFGGTLLLLRLFLFWETEIAPSLNRENPLVHIEKDTSNTALPKKYINERFQYAINIPERFTVGQFDEGDTEIVITLFKSENEEEEFQIAARAFDEAGPIKVARIKEDLPDVAIINPQEVLLNGGAIHALLFESRDDAGTPTREVWFIHGGLLVQATGFLGHDDVIGSVLESFRFIE